MSVRALAYGMVMVAIACTVGALPSPAHAVRVAFINPGPPEDQYWRNVTDVMQAAADDFGMTLEVQHAFHSKAYLLKILDGLLKQETRPDYIVFRPIGDAARIVLGKTAQAGIKVVTIDSPLPATTRIQIGGPRETFKNWIGAVEPDYATAAAKLGQLLAKNAVHNKAYSKRKIAELVAVTGPKDDPVVKSQLRAMKAAVKEVPRARMMYSKSGEWNRRDGERAAYKIFRVFNQASGWIGGNDEMTLGILQLLDNTRRAIGRDTFLGSFHWTEPAIRALLKKRIHYIVGGHFTQGAVALTLIHDFESGRDFEDQGLTQELDLAFLYSKNVQSIGQVMVTRNWGQIDFRIFSRAANPNLQNYDFRVQHFLKRAQ